MHVYSSTLIISLTNIESSSLGSVILASKVNVNSSISVDNKVLETKVHHGIVTSHFSRIHFECVITTNIGGKTLANIDFAISSSYLDITSIDVSSTTVVVEATDGSWLCGCEIDKHFDF
jgi:hypothetical protein